MNSAIPSPSPGRKDAQRAKLRSPLLAPVMPHSRHIQRRTTNDFFRSWSHKWNEFVDETYYNVKESDEQAIQKWVDRNGLVTEGSIVVVAPVDGDIPQIFPDAFEFLTKSIHETVGAICVPGVGSSVLGAVGLARDVATARNLRVAAVVSGYGMSEALFDAFGGAYCFRGVNQLEMVFEHTRRGLENMMAFFNLLPEIETYDSVAGGPALVTVKSLLRDKRLPALEMVVGHSKGNLLLSGAIGELVCEGVPIERLKKTKVVLFSAISALPDIAAETWQIIGDLDVLGWGNSRLTIPYKGVPNAMHHLNRKIPCYLDAVDELAAI
jgi:hypothetical protein